MSNNTDLIKEENTAKLDLAKTLRNMASGLENGTIDKISIVTNSNGTTEIIQDSNQGANRTIVTKEQSLGYDKSCVETIEKQKPQERRITVCKLKKDGLSQNEIAKRTNVSQKTISNDINYLRKNNKCSI